MGDEIFAFQEAVKEAMTLNHTCNTDPSAAPRPPASNRRCRNCLDPSSELRSGFGEACEVAAGNHLYLIELSADEKTAIRRPLFGQRVAGVFGHVSRYD